MAKTGWVTTAAAFFGTITGTLSLLVSYANYVREEQKQQQTEEERWIVNIYDKDKDGEYPTNIFRRSSRDNFARISTISILLPRHYAIRLNKDTKESAETISVNKWMDRFGEIYEQILILARPISPSFSSATYESRLSLKIDYEEPFGRRQPRSVIVRSEPRTWLHAAGERP